MLVDLATLVTRHRPNIITLNWHLHFKAFLGKSRFFLSLYDSFQGLAFPRKQLPRLIGGEQGGRSVVLEYGVTEAAVLHPNMALLPARVLEAALNRCRSALHILLFCIVFAVLLKSRPVLGKKSQPKEITDSNWEEILQGEWMIEL